MKNNIKYKTGFIRRSVFRLFGISLALSTIISVFSNELGATCLGTKPASKCAKTLPSQDETHWVNSGVRVTCVTSILSTKCAWGTDKDGKNGACYVGCVPPSSMRK